jgi:hypothetical protein
VGSPRPPSRPLGGEAFEELGRLEADQGDGVAPPIGDQPVSRPHMLPQSSPVELEDLTGIASPRLNVLEQLIDITGPGLAVFGYAVGPHEEEIYVARYSPVGSSCRSEKAGVQRGWLPRAQLPLDSRH